MDPKFAVCANGKSRSPINLGKAKVGVDKKLKPLIREYNSAYVALVNNKFNSAVSFSALLLLDRIVFISFKYCPQDQV